MIQNTIITKSKVSQLSRTLSHNSFQKQSYTDNNKQPRQGERKFSTGTGIHKASVCAKTVAVGLQRMLMSMCWHTHFFPAKVNGKDELMLTLKTTVVTAKTNTHKVTVIKCNMQLRGEL